MSARDGRDNICKTYIGRLFIGQLPFDLEDKQMETDVDPEFLETNKAIEQKEKKTEFINVSETLGTLSENKDGSLKFEANKKSKVMELRE
jgi:hypothetical protein